MRGIWRCSSCVAVLIAATWSTAVRAEPAPTQTIAGGVTPMAEKLAKAQVTQFPLHPHKRDADSCPTSHSLCPSSLSGGCCQNGYSCGTDSCYLTTMETTVSACGKVGFFACPISLNGGCCPVGYICGSVECTAPAGLTSVNTACPNNMYLCPASYHYGCCYNGMACGPNACYSTVPATYTVSSKVVITSDGHTSTSYSFATTVMTPTIPAGLPTNDPNYAAKFIPTAIAKVSPTSTDNGGGSGLSSAQIGGIVGGAIAVLLVVLTAAFLIIRHLNRVVDAVESRKEASSGAQTKSAAQLPHMAYNHDKLHPSPSEVDAMSYDPLMMTNPSSGNTPQAVSSNVRNRSDSESMASTPYNPSSATADLAAIRHTSMESSGSYFDHVPPARVSNVPGRHPGSFNVNGSHRASTDSQGTQFTTAYPAYAYQQHGRQYSNASEAGSSDAGGVGSPLIPAELDPTGVVGELPTSPDPSGARSRASSITSPRTSMQARRRSDPPVSAATARNETVVGLGFQQPLDVVNEGAEVIHGYYGPRDQAVGQTAAGLDIMQDVSSPMHGNAATRWEGSQLQNNMPPNTVPPSELPPNTYPTNTYPPNAYPPDAYPPDAYPQNAHPPNTYPPNTYPPNNFPPNNNP